MSTLDSLLNKNVGYDEQTVAVMRKVIRPDSCCIDIGAHAGSILASMVKLAPEGVHFAFEPLPHLAAQLRTTFDAPNIHIHEMAVGDADGSASFVYVENDPAYSGLRQRIYDRPDPALRPLTVACGRIDDLVSSDLRVDFIKLDIEGGEFHALKGAAQTIARCRPVIVFEAGLKSTGQYGVTPEALYALITSEFGYHLSTMQRWLANEKPYTEAGFVQNWFDDTDFYFIAYA